MTINEAIQRLKTTDACDSDLCEALDMAIKALEQQPCDDVCEWFEQYVDIVTDIVEFRFSDGTVKRAKRGLYMRDIEKSLRKMLIDQMANEKKQEPCEDCISRQAVLDEMYKRQEDGDAITAGFIKKLPSVTPQSYEDVISRQAALNSLMDNTHLEGYDLAEALDAIENTDKLPSVTPQPRWIPVSERLPEEDGEYLATIYDMDENYEYIDIAELEDGKWCYKPYILVKTWMPLPKPYKAEGSKE